MSNEQNRIANRNAALRWGGFVVIMLGLQVAGGAFAIYLATGDPSVAVVPDYHQKALNWDEEIRLRQQSADFRWTVQLDVAGSGGLVVNVKDDSGNFVPVQSGRLQLYHHARAGSVLRVPITANAGEPIVVQDCFSRPGLWQVDLSLVDSVGRQFVDSQSVNVKSPTEVPERS